MHNPLKIAFAIFIAAVCSKPLMSGLQYFIVPDGQQLSISYLTESFNTRALFALFFCACAGLTAAVGCYLRRYSLPMRGLIVLVPMLIAGSLVTLLKAAQFREAQSAAATFGMPLSFSLQTASFHMVPAVALAAGSLAVTVSLFLRTKNSQPDTAPNDSCSL